VRFIIHSALSVSEWPYPLATNWSYRSCTDAGCNSQYAGTVGPQKPGTFMSFPCTAQGDAGRLQRVIAHVQAHTCNTVGVLEKRGASAEWGSCKCTWRLVGKTRLHYSPKSFVLAQ